MRTKHICGCFLCLFLAAAFLCALAETDVNDLYVDGYTQRAFTTQDGLTTARITAIAQTPEGCVWLGGHGSLTRFDGRNFERMTGFPSADVSCMCTDSNGVLWIGTADAGLFRCCNNTFVNISEQAGDEIFLNVYCMAEVPGQGLYFGAKSGMAIVREGDAIEYVSDLRNEPIRGIAVSPEGEVVAIGENGALFVRESGAWREVRMVGLYGEMRCITYGEQAGCFMIGTEEGVILRCDGALNMGEPIRPDGVKGINDIMEMDDGALLLCSDGGAALLYRGKTYPQNLSIEGAIAQTMRDCEGNCWFLSRDAGVLLALKSPFTDITARAGLPKGRVNAIVADENRICIGSCDGLMVLDAKGLYPIEGAFDLPDCDVRDLWMNADGDLWVATYDRGLICLRRDGMQEVFSSETQPQMKSDAVLSLCEAPEGLLFGTTAGAYCLQDGVVLPLTASGAPRGAVPNIACHNGAIWLATEGDGVYIIRDAEIEAHLTAENGLPSDAVRKTVESPSLNGVWIVMPTRLAFYTDEGELRTAQVPTEDNLDCIIEPDGVMWILAGDGVYRTTEIAILEGSFSDNMVFRSGELIPYGLTPDARYAQAGNRIYLCGRNGCFMMDPERAKQYKTPLTFFVDAVCADGEALAPGDDDMLTIGADVRRLTFVPKLLAHTLMDLEIRYRLDGFDKDYQIMSAEAIGPIVYTNLRGGNYTMNLSVVDNAGETVLSKVKFDLQKELHWYEIPAIWAAAAALIVAFMVAIVWMLTNNRHMRKIRTYEKDHAQRERLALSDMAFKDYLTRLYNRNYLETWERLHRDSAGYVTFIVIDCNNLKKINDVQGHEKGDLFLMTVADQLMNVFSDEKYTSFRTGGDEFLVVGKNVSYEQAEALCRKGLDVMADKRVGGISMSVSYGIYTMWVDDAFSVEEGIRLADMEMLDMKHEFHGN